MNSLKTKFTALAFIVFFISFDAKAENFGDFYYAFKNKVNFTKLSDKIIIKKNANIKPVDYEKYLTSSIREADVEWISENICEVSLSKNIKESFSNNKLFDLIRANTETESIQNLNRLKDGFEFGFTNEIVIKFIENIDTNKRNEILNKFSLQKIKSTKAYELCVADKYVDILETANALFETGVFEFAYPNIICRIEPTAYYPNDTYFKYQVALHNTGQLFTDGHTGNDDADIDMPEAWDITKGSSDVVVAVLDQGVTFDHPDLPNTRQVRLNGSNFGSGNANDPSPTGNDNHGNACAGVIAATMDNNEGIAGVAPICKIMPLRWDTSTTAIQMADAIQFATDNGANIISNSWSYRSSNSNLIPAIISAIQYAINKGVVVICSAGNTAKHSRKDDGFVSFPANVDIHSLITVGASDRYDKQSDYSPTSQLIDVVAPSHKAYPSSIGVETLEMWSLDIPGNSGYNPWPATSSYPHPPMAGTTLPTNLAYTGRFGGTSFSCPIVAGIAALILSINKNLTPQQVYNTIIETTDKIGGYSYTNGKCNQTGYGRVNANKALQKAICTLPFLTFSKTINTDETINGSKLQIYNTTVKQNNKLTINACDEVILNPTFTVETGAELEINILP